MKGAENFAKLSGVSFAMLFGDISPNIRTMTVVIAVENFSCSFYINAILSSFIPRNFKTHIKIIPKYAGLS